MRLIAIALFFITTTVWAQRNPNNLPQCPEANLSVQTDSKSKWYLGEQTANWNECWGLYDREVIRGTVIKKNGDIVPGKWTEEYEGEWRGGLLDGIGRVIIYTDFDKSISEISNQYFGAFKEGKPHGKARYTSYNTQRLYFTYEGEFKNGEYDGRGTESNYSYTVLNEQKVTKSIGNWTAGKKNGRFLTIYPDGKSIVNTWIDGKWMGP